MQFVKPCGECTHLRPSEQCPEGLSLWSIAQEYEMNSRNTRLSHIARQGEAMKYYDTLNKYFKHVMGIRSGKEH